MEILFRPGAHFSLLGLARFTLAALLVVFIDLADFFTDLRELPFTPGVVSGFNEGFLVGGRICSVALGEAAGVGFLDRWAVMAALISPFSSSMLRVVAEGRRRSSP